MNKYHLKQTYIYWSICVFFGCILLFQFNLKSESHDSQYYSEQVVFYKDRPFKELLAPKWNSDSYGFDPNSYMRDQLPTHIIMGVMGTKLGLPAKDSLQVIEMLFQIFTIIVIYKIVNQIVPKERNYLIFYGLLFFPFAFSYNLRANHESGISLLTSLCILAGINFEQKKFQLIYIFSSIFLLMIKGPFVIFCPILCALAIFLIKGLDKNIILNFFISNIIVLLFSALIIYFYEKSYILITGESFFETFINIQFKSRALNLKNEYPFIIQKILNFFYYFQHELVYSLPWSLIALIIILNKKFKKLGKFGKLFFPNKAAWLLFLSAISISLILAMSNRVAGRYAYPAYYFMTSYFITICKSEPNFFSKFSDKYLQPKMQYFIPMLWSLAFLLHFIKN